MIPAGDYSKSAFQHAQADAFACQHVSFSQSKTSLAESVLLWDSLKRTSISPHFP
jgi:hypothetical protein